ncbi:hypothetical protein [Streptomyces sp. NPDC048560]|uniref:hypothetical protein n=1 Tax=Streptomyces sp. NPDC048560 TaxID=3155488 RepID=UPI00342AB0D7
MSVYDVARHMPGISALSDLCRAMAMLDAILCREWADRWHSYDAQWSASGEQPLEVASMRNGSGDEYSIVFSPDGVYARGFDHESPMSPYVDDVLWPGVLDDVPAVFQRFVEEPSFGDESGVPLVTACLWRETSDSAWRTGDIDLPEEGEGADGADYLFQLLVAGTPEAYLEWAEDYYEITLDPAAVRHVYDLRPLTADVVAALNPEIALDDLADDVKETGYPAGP